MTENMKSNTFGRRTFMMTLATGGAALGVALSASAQASVAENDPQAAAVGYRADATKVDKAKQPKYAAGQVCSGCALYQGANGSVAGGCALFAGKQVSAKGWCNAWAKKG
jgi:hypothetical protein